MCGNHACRGAWVRSVVAFGGRRSDSELWRQLHSSHANARITTYAYRGVGCASGLPREMRVDPQPGVILRCCHALSGSQPFVSTACDLRLSRGAAGPERQQRGHSSSPQAEPAPSGVTDRCTVVRGWNCAQTSACVDSTRWARRGSPGREGGGNSRRPRLPATTSPARRLH